VSESRVSGYRLSRIATRLVKVSPWPARLSVRTCARSSSILTALVATWSAASSVPIVDSPSSFPYTSIGARSCTLATSWRSKDRVRVGRTKNPQTNLRHRRARTWSHGDGGRADHLHVGRRFLLAKRLPRRWAACLLSRRRQRSCEPVVPFFPWVEQRRFRRQGSMRCPSRTKSITCRPFGIASRPMKPRYPCPIGIVRFLRNGWQTIGPIQMMVDRGKK
jgi:hypothetical protein